MLDMIQLKNGDIYKSKQINRVHTLTYKYISTK